METAADQSRQRVQRSRRLLHQQEIWALLLYQDSHVLHGCAGKAEQIPADNFQGIVPPDALGNICRPPMNRRSLAGFSTVMGCGRSGNNRLHARSNDASEWQLATNGIAPPLLRLCDRLMSGIRHVDDLLPITASCFQKGDQHCALCCRDSLNCLPMGTDRSLRQELIKGPDFRQGLEFYRHLLATGLGNPTRSPEAV